jgi:hypothetical protein
VHKNFIIITKHVKNPELDIKQGSGASLFEAAPELRGSGASAKLAAPELQGSESYLMSGNEI